MGKIGGSTGGLEGVDVGISVEVGCFSGFFWGSLFFYFCLLSFSPFSFRRVLYLAGA